MAQHPKRPRDPNQLAKSIIDIATGQKSDRDPTPEEQAEIHEAIRQGLADIEAGRYRPADEVMDELRAKYNLPRE